MDNENNCNSIDNTCGGFENPFIGTLIADDLVANNSLTANEIILNNGTSAVNITSEPGTSYDMILPAVNGTVENILYLDTNSKLKFQQPKYQMHYRFNRDVANKTQDNLLLTSDNFSIYTVLTNENLIMKKVCVQIGRENYTPPDTNAFTGTIVVSIWRSVDDGSNYTSTTWNITQTTNPALITLPPAFDKFSSGVSQFIFVKNDFSISYNNDDFLAISVDYSATNLTNGLEFTASIYFETDLDL